MALGSGPACQLPESGDRGCVPGRDSDRGSRTPATSDGHPLREEEGGDVGQHPEDPYLLLELDAQAQCEQPLSSQVGGLREGLVHHGCQGPSVGKAGGEERGRGCSSLTPRWGHPAPAFPSDRTPAELSSQHASGRLSNHRYNSFTGGAKASFWFVFFLIDIFLTHHLTAGSNPHDLKSCTHTGDGNTPKRFGLVSQERAPGQLSPYQSQRLVLSPGFSL